MGGSVLVIKMKLLQTIEGGEKRKEEEGGREGGGGKEGVGGE